MKKLSIILALLCGCFGAPAQPNHNFYDSALVRYIDSLPAEQPFDTSRPWQKWDIQLLYIVSDRDIYHLFGYTVSRQFKETDFSRYHILGEQRCNQCMTTCHHEDGQTACHRNRCNLKWVWSLRENSKAFDSIAITNLIPLPEGNVGQRSDTVIRAEAGFSDWYVTGFGDCHARFEYNLFADRWYPSIILIERNIYGGCRAAGRKEYLIRFPEQTGKKEFYKQTILVD